MAEKYRRSNYKKLQAYDTHDIYVHKNKNGKPKFVAVTARGPAWDYIQENNLPNKNFRVNIVNDNSLIDLKININEYMMGIYGPPYITGYGLGGYPPEETYRGVRIGKFTERDNAEFLPRYTAGLELDGEFVWVDRMTIAEVKKGLDELLDKRD